MRVFQANDDESSADRRSLGIDEDQVAVMELGLHVLHQIPPGVDEQGLPGISAYRTTCMVFGAERTVLVTYNENLFLAQSRSLLREIAKRQQRLRELQQQLRRWQRS